MCFSSLQVSLDFEWIWTFLYGETGQPPNEQGLVATDNELVYYYVMKQGYFEVKYKFIKLFTY